MYSSKDELLKRAERHESNAKQLRELAAGRYVNDAGQEVATVDDNGKLTFTGRNPSLATEEFDRFATWLRRCKRR